MPFVRSLFPHRFVGSALALCAFGLTPLTGEEGPSPERVQAIKAATVLIKVKAGPLKGSGSGFVVRTDKEGVVYVVTNMHVVAPAFLEMGLLPAHLAKELKEAVAKTTVEVIFDSGTPSERKAAAKVLAGDRESDLAVLKIKGIADPPRPIDLTKAPTLTETIPVLTAGFPFGDQLAIGDGSPAITIGKATVSSVRVDEAGAVEMIQLDGALNPGNSGGPVLTLDGKLVGVAVSAIRGAGLGFAVPFQKVNAVLSGRVTTARVESVATKGGKKEIVVSADLVDPFDGINRKAVRVHLLRTDDKAGRPVKPANGKWPPLPGAEQKTLTVEGKAASVRFPYPEQLAAIWSQVEYTRADGTMVYGKPTRHARPRTKTNLTIPEPYSPSSSTAKRKPPAAKPQPGPWAPLRNPAEKIPASGDGVTKLLDLARFPDRFADGKPVTVHAGIQLGLQNVQGPSYKLKVMSENDAAVADADFYLPRDLAADIGHAMDHANVTFPARLTVARIRAPHPRIKSPNKLNYEVHEIGLFDDSAAIAKTYRTGGGKVKDDPTILDVDRNPELYAGRQLLLEGAFIFNEPKAGKAVQLYSVWANPIANLNLQIPTDLLVQCRADAKQMAKELRLTCTFAKTDGGKLRWPVAVSKIEAIGKKGETLKTLTSEAAVTPRRP